MAITAEDLIEQARDYSPVFTRSAIPDITALKALSRLEKQLAEMVVQEYPDALAEWYAVTLPLPVDWEDGILLPEHLMVLGAELTYPDGLKRGTWEVSLLHSAQAQTQPHMYPSVYIMNGRLYLTDIRKWYGDLHGWEDMDNLRLRIVPEIGNLNLLSDPISLPDTAEAALVANLALWMADRVGTSLTTLRERAEASAKSWAMGVVDMGSTRSWMVEVVE